MINDSQEKMPEYNPLVSIIIGNYNYDRFIKKAIDSAINQTYKNIEIIVVDDGSTDSSREIIAGYEKRIIPVLKENAGQPSNYNAGFAASQGDIICFLDSDDIFLSNKIATIVNIYKSYEEIDWCFHSIQLVDENIQPVNKCVTENYVSRVCDFRKRLKAGKIPPNLPPTSALSFKRDLLEKILPMPTTKKMPGSDHYIKYMAVALSKGFILAEDLTLQRIHGNNMGTLRKDRRHMRARENLFTGYWIRQEFPEFRKFANKLFAVGTASNWSIGNNDLENVKLISDYFSLIYLREILNVNFIVIYYYLKGKLFN